MSSLMIISIMTLLACCGKRLMCSIYSIISLTIMISANLTIMTTIAYSINANLSTILS